jgi:hypothetical protein
MNKLNKEKRGRLVLVGVGTALITLALYFFVICAQRQQIEEQEDKIVRTSELLNKDERWIRQRPTIGKALNSAPGVRDSSGGYGATRQVQVVL